MNSSGMISTDSKRASRLAIGVVAILVLAASIFVAIAWPRYQTLRLLRSLADLPDLRDSSLYDLMTSATLVRHCCVPVESTRRS